jgi:hypothetical protein
LLLLQYSILNATCQGLFSFFSSGALNAGDVFFDAPVDSVVAEEGDRLSFEETMGEIFDLTESHFFSLLIIMLPL